METVGLQPTEEIGIARRLCKRNPLLQYQVKWYKSPNMKATLTLKIKLEATEQDSQSLSETQKAYVVALYPADAFR
jgi:hypothetical protein